MSTIQSTPLAGKRILVAKPGLDGHDAGAKVIVLALRDAGAEVIYTGLRRSPEYIVRVALDEDVDAIGLSILSGGHLHLANEVIQLLRQSGGDRIDVFLGGTIPRADHDALYSMGVGAIFSAEQTIFSIISLISERLENREGVPG